MAKYDVYDIERRLREFDDKILRIDFDERQGMHRIMCWDPVNKEEYIAMSVPAGELDVRVERRMMEINPAHFNALAEFDRMKAERERAQDQKIEDMAYNMADMLYKPLLQDAGY